MSRAAFRGFQVFCALVVLACLSLGAWQVQRYFWKKELRTQAQALATADPIELPVNTQVLPAHTPLLLTGRFLTDKDILIRGFALGGASGSRIYAPFELTDGRLVVLLRGWVPRDREEALGVRDPVVQTLTGHWRPSRAKGGFLQPVNAPDMGIWTHIDTVELAQHWGTADLVAGGYVELRGPVAAAQGAQIAPFALDLFDRHLEYVLTWWMLALILIVVYLLVWRDQRRKHQQR